jgi:hypothetical protein
MLDFRFSILDYRMEESGRFVHRPLHVTLDALPLARECKE